MKKCIVGGCNKLSRRRGYCPNHSAKFYKYGDPLGKYVKPTCKISNCNGKYHAKGFCNTHYNRLHTTGNLEINKPTAKERYYSSYKKLRDVDCWIWNKGLTQDGYGKFTALVNGVKRTLVASRYGWELIHGKIPQGYFVCHKCDNPSCQNPKHWFLGSPLDNTRDMIKKGRSNWVGRPKDSITGRFI